MHRRTLKRIDAPGHARFLTCSCFKQQPLFNDDRFKRLFVEQVFTARSRFGFRLIAWDVMPEHIHLLILPDHRTPEVGPILAAMKRRTAARALALFRAESGERPAHLLDVDGVARFWQRGGGYDRNIVSQTELVEKIRYIHENPVRRGLCVRPENWEWSSCRAWEGVATEWPDIDRQ